MPAVMCFGDSNTWGSDPADSNRRFPNDVRYTGVVRAELGEGWTVFEEGLGGRSTVFDIQPYRYRSGGEMLGPLVETHAPLDVVTILLGTNDVSLPYLTAADVAKGAGELVSIVQRSGLSGPIPGDAESVPRVLLISPPVVGPLLPEDLAVCASAVETSRQLAPAYERIAELMGCSFLDLAPVVTTSPVDGWHWEADQHANGGRAIAAAVRAMVPS